MKEKLKGKNIICNGYMAGSSVIALPVQAPVVMIVTEVLSVRHVMEQGKRRINQRTVTTMAKTCEQCIHEEVGICLLYNIDISFSIEGCDDFEVWHEVLSRCNKDGDNNECD